MAEQRAGSEGRGDALSRRARRWWAIAGSGLLAAIVLVAVFSLGVYVGRRGWGVQAPAAMPAQVPEPAHPLPAEPPAPWPPSRPALAGVIRSVGPEGILVETPQGARLVRIAAGTRCARLTDQGEAEASCEALRPGVAVDVFGSLAADGRTLTADRVVVLPPE